jgi:PAS domain S-box-containing protein
MKRNHTKTNEQLIAELGEMRQRISKLEAPEAERKWLEETLRDSEVKWRSFTENTDDTIVVTDNNNVIRYINRTIPPTIPEGVIGKTIYAYVSEEHHNVMTKSLERVYKTGRPDSYEVTLDMSRINPEMGTMWFRTKVIPIKSDKEVTGVIMIATDITGRKRAEYDLDERIKELNCLYGITNIAERPGITLDELYREVANLLPPSWQYPEITCARVICSDEEFRTDNFNTTERVQAANINVGGQKEGTIEVYYLEARPEIDEGPFLKEERLLINAVAERLGKITERKQAEEELKRSEERLKIIFEYAPDGIYLNDFKGNFVDGNRAAEGLIGYTRDELIGKNFLKLKLLSPGQILKAAANLAKNALGQPTGPDEFILNRNDRSQVTVEISTFPIKIKGKALVLSIARDITERKKIEIEREKLIKDLGASLKKIQTLSGLIPICAWCKKIRDDKGYWESVEAYIGERTKAEFTHGMCPECAEKYWAGKGS